MSQTQAAASESTPTVAYQYNTQGTVRARLQDAAEIMLDMKLVQQTHATPEYLATAGGQAAEARSAGFELGFLSAADIGLETMNEITGQWRAVNSTTSFAIVARLPN